MSVPTESYRKVAYDLRPAKQVERRMLIDTLQILMANDFPIRDYQYTGMGSIYFFDFVLFHKLLGVRKMLSVEWDKTIPARIDFNKPYADIAVEMEAIGDVLPTLDTDTKHLLWLDYDDRLTETAVNDAVFAARHVPAGSILLITVDVEPPSDGKSPAEWRLYYEEQAKQYFQFDWDDSAFSLSALPRTNARILFNAIESGLASRKSVRFKPLFNFWYADGHAMLTVGGMIASDVEESRLNGCDFSRSSFLRFDVDSSPFEIRPPKLTRKERLLLDHHMPCADDWKPAEFELKKEELDAYREIYRFYPAYAELLV
jgi:prepilin-type processing-associated H-X9-DG protein